MAAEVSSLMRLLTRHNKDDDGGGGGEGSRARDLVTRDLLGGCGDGKEHDRGLSSPRIADLNMPPLCSSAFPPPARPPAPLLQGLLQERAPGGGLDLRLRPSEAAPPPPLAEYQSVCTLEKVRCALERAQRESPALRKQAAPPASSPTSSSTTTTSAKRLRRWEEEGARRGSKSPLSPSSPSSSSSVVVQSGGEEGAGTGAAGMAAAGCPSCLLYVLIARSDPRCPRCNAAVPLPPPQKRPRIDLNANASGAEQPPAVSTPLRTVNFF